MTAFELLCLAARRAWDDPCEDTAVELATAALAYEGRMRRRCARRARQARAEGRFERSWQLAAVGIGPSAGVTDGGRK